MDLEDIYNPRFYKDDVMLPADREANSFWENEDYSSLSINEADYD